jgi:hypothetical protein
MLVPPQDWIFIADEAGTSQDRFTVVGGIALHRDVLIKVYRTLSAYREKYSMKAELKWSKISDQKQDEYKALVDYFFALNNKNHVEFHSLIFDSHQWNHQKYNKGDGDIGLSKLFYQLLLHRFVKTYGNHGSLYIRLDHRNSSTSLESLRRMLNSGVAKEYDVKHNPVKQLVSMDSKQCDILQMNDVILGAVCAARNGKHLIDGGKISKKNIANIVLEKSGLTTFDINSPAHVHRFTIWNMRPKPR